MMIWHSDATPEAWLVESAQALMKGQSSRPAARWRRNRTPVHASLRVEVFGRHGQRLGAGTSMSRCLPAIRKGPPQRTRNADQALPRARETWSACISNLPVDAAASSRAFSLGLPVEWLLFALTPLVRGLATSVAAFNPTPPLYTRIAAKEIAITLQFSLLDALGWQIPGRGGPVAVGLAAHPLVLSSGRSRHE